MSSFEPSFLSVTSSLKTSAKQAAPISTSTSCSCRCRHACLVLLAHPSCEPPSTVMMLEPLLLALQKDIGQKMIRLAYVERDVYSLYGEAEEAIRQGACCLLVLPLFGSGQRRLAYPVPLQIQQLRHSYPGVDIGLLPPVGFQPKMHQVISDIARSALAIPCSP